MQFFHAILAVIAATPAFALLDCGGGRAPIKTTVSGCPGYVEPTETPSYAPMGAMPTHPVASTYPSEETPIVPTYPPKETSDNAVPTILSPTQPPYVASGSAMPSPSANSTGYAVPSGSAVPSVLPEGSAGHVLPGMLSVLGVVAAGMMLA